MEGKTFETACSEIDLLCSAKDEHFRPISGRTIGSKRNRDKEYLKGIFPMPYVQKMQVTTAFCRNHGAGEKLLTCPGSADAPAIVMQTGKPGYPSGTAGTTPVWAEHAQENNFWGVQRKQNFWWKRRRRSPETVGRKRLKAKGHNRWKEERCLGK